MGSDSGLTDVAVRPAERLFSEILLPVPAIFLEVRHKGAIAEVDVEEIAGLARKAGDFSGAPVDKVSLASSGESGRFSV